MTTPREPTTPANRAPHDPAMATTGTTATRDRATATRDSITDVWGPRTPHVGEWPVRVDARMHRDADRWVRSAVSYTHLTLPTICSV